MKTANTVINRMNLFCKATLLIAFCAVSVITTAQGQKKTTDRYKMELRLVKDKYVLSEDNDLVDLRFLVTITTTSGKEEDFPSRMIYSYKKYQDADYYLEAVDMNGKPVNVEGDDDVSYMLDPLDKGIRTEKKIVEHVNTVIYKFKPGKYKIRWVYDSANNISHNGWRIQPTYSNWETIEVLP
jgi:hypothetical protein